MTWAQGGSANDCDDDDDDIDDDDDDMTDKADDLDDIGDTPFNPMTINTHQIHTAQSKFTIRVKIIDGFLKFHEKASNIRISIIGFPGIEKFQKVINTLIKDNFESNFSKVEHEMLLYENYFGGGVIISKISS